MSFELETLSDLFSSAFDAVIDVRSPNEFAEDHLPGAINLPVLSNEERARVGTIYTQESPFLARKTGAALVARNAARHIEEALGQHDGSWRPLVYCWRGGQRSGSFASILHQIGWRVEVLNGGYQSYRRQVVARLYERHFPSQVVLLDGNTGTGKTSILKRLPNYGVQVIDLEGLSRHRGSALGGQGPQPSQKAFESGLVQVVESLDPKKPVVVEAESSKIGQINIPPRLFAEMRTAPRIRIEASLDARAALLERAYGDVLDDISRFSSRLDRLVQYQGKDRVEAWKTQLQMGQFRTVASELMQQHYDPRYEKTRQRHEARLLDTLSADALDDAGIDQLASSIAYRVKQL